MPNVVIAGESRIRKELIVPDRGECWIWEGALVRGYGRVWIRGKNCSAHRVMYELWMGIIPAGLGLDHLCRTPACVNPAHLEAVTQKVNMERGISSTKTHCKHGHPFDTANTVIYRGARRCRACNRESQRQIQKRNLAIFRKNQGRP